MTDTDDTSERERPLRLADLIDATVNSTSPVQANTADGQENRREAAEFTNEWSVVRAEATRRTAVGALPPGGHDSLVEAAREAAHERIAEFRSATVAVPLDERGSPWSAEEGGVRWILAFSSEATLARFALARGRAERAWDYRSVPGARLLDAVVPAVGVPCGVALDVGGADGALFPPVSGIVPDSAAVDTDDGGES
ncbi:hypothetical protein NLX86_16290 [Streptomyces sp. A3M-1-3]|uniref:hypothetical protein n=1 Tax=Streptomyces sp. A3M-1-3 TaxID=2962044 RepID=UPI0020B7A9EF|nr:hypothetical protein [Streptomyces sp. A3M-1-3]MCP3819603.1 hypothetical protein [Streptomyces sp. A3M-1-3]